MPLYPQGVAFPLGNIPQSHRNILGRNGGFEVWQRGAGNNASFGLPPNTMQYTADGWWFACGTNQQSIASRGGGLVDGSWSSGIFFRNPGQTGVGQYWLEYPLDTDEIAQAQNKFVTLSLTAGGGADFSPGGGLVYAFLYTGTGAPVRRFGGAYTGEIMPINAAPMNVPRSTVARFTFTSSVVVPKATTQASLALLWTPVGTAGANDYLVLDDVQLEVGSVATPFERRPFESELLACMRHYEKTFNYAQAPAQGTGTATGALFTNRSYGTNAVCSSHWSFKVTKRITPTVITYNPAVANANYRNGAGTGDYTVNPSNVNEQRITLETLPTTVASDLGYIHASADAGI